MIRKAFIGWSALVLFAALAFISPSVCPAASIALSPVYAQAYSADFTTALGVPFTLVVGQYMQIDVRMTFSGAAVGEDFGSVGFNIGGYPTALLTPVVLSGASPWMRPRAAADNLAALGGPFSVYSSPSPALQSYTNFDLNGASPGGSTAHFSQNTDGGVAGDLLAILVAAGNIEANNRQYGEAVRPAAGYADQLGARMLLGSVLFRAAAPGTLSSIASITAVAGVPWASWIGNSAGSGTSANGSAQAFTGVSLISALGGPQLTIVLPEPASLVMMGFAGLGLALVARRREA